MNPLWRSSASLARKFLFSTRANAALCTTHCSFSSQPPEDPTQVMEPPIPKYQHRTDEPTETKRARLLYQSRKRGMAENGLLLSTFAGEHLNSLNESQLTAYDKLINEPTNDWEIFYWITETKPTPKEYESDVMDMLKEHTKNAEKKERLVQPDLYA